MYAYTLANCTGEVYQLTEEACWINFIVENVESGVQGVLVSCSESTGSASTSASAAATTGAATSSASSSAATSSVVDM